MPEFTLDGETRAILERMIAALERIAAALERQQAQTQQPTTPSRAGPYLNSE
jgi:hypothetical protein